LTKSIAPEAPGFILIEHGDAEVLRRQCEAAARSAQSENRHIRVQLIPLPNRKYCIRLYGSRTDLSHLLNSLKHPDSGWKPHAKPIAWWRGDTMLLTTAKPGILLLRTRSGLCAAILSDKAENPLRTDDCVPFLHLPLNPDTLTLMESTSFE